MAAMEDRGLGPASSGAIRRHRRAQGREGRGVGSGSGHRTDHGREVEVEGRARTPTAPVADTVTAGGKLSAAHVAGGVVCGGCGLDGRQRAVGGG